MANTKKTARKLPAHSVLGQPQDASSTAASPAAQTAEEMAEVVEGPDAANQQEEEAERAERDEDQPPTGGVRNPDEADRFQRKCTTAAAELVTTLREDRGTPSVSSAYRNYLEKIKRYSSEIVRSMRHARASKVLKAVRDHAGLCLLNETTYQDPQYLQTLELNAELARQKEADKKIDPEIDVKASETDPKMT